MSQRINDEHPLAFPAQEAHGPFPGENAQALGEGSLPGPRRAVMAGEREAALWAEERMSDEAMASIREKCTH